MCNCFSAFVASCESALYKCNNNNNNKSLLLQVCVINKGASVRAAAAGIIAADFTAALTDSPLQVAVAQRLPAASQRC